MNTFYLLHKHEKQLCLIRMIMQMNDRIRHVEAQIDNHSDIFYNLQISGYKRLKDTRLKALDRLQKYYYAID